MDVTPRRDGDGALQRVVVSFLDITPRVHAEDAARVAEARFRMSSSIAAPSTSAEAPSP